MPDARSAAGPLARLRDIIGSATAPPLTVAALCEEYGEVCESAVDPLEIASALEFEGMGDQTVRERYGYSDVFTLAEQMYVRVPRRPADRRPRRGPVAGGPVPSPRCTACCTGCPRCASRPPPCCWAARART